MQLDNKRIVVTGASSGIGKEMCQQLLQRQGVKVMGTASSDASRLPQNNAFFPFVGDLSKEDTVDNLFDQGLQKMGGIDIFFANAGFSYIEKFGNPNWNHLASIFQTNVFSPIYALQKMLQTHAHTARPFQVVITASAISKLPFPYFSLYASTKFALDGFARSVRPELPSHAQLVMAYPVATRTRFFERNGEGAPVPGPAQSAEQVARKILRGVETGKQNIHFLPLMGGVVSLLALIPPLERAFVRRQKKTFDESGFFG
ncbi:MAG TPA: SDR family NAD(P)-dependent oxidoreductase [Thermotogota bacterium]|nr:SDR family NAD(P)-dependent oxidoreductase [Thermotogota bacterium]HRW93887.1 SDR family NAD(P)-dependent oxidoreductase [Thermotogota bacterium]